MAGPSPPPLLGTLLRRVQDDVNSTARVDAAGHTDRVYASHAQALTHLLRDAVIKRDWSRAAGACVSLNCRGMQPLTRCDTALASAGLVVGPPLLGDPREFYRRSDAPVELLQLVRLHCKRGRAPGVLTGLCLSELQAMEVCAQHGAQFTPQLEAAVRRRTRKRARLRRDATVAAHEGSQWAAALAVRGGDLDGAAMVASRAKQDVAAALFAYAQWCVVLHVWMRAGWIP